MTVTVYGSPGCYACKMTHMHLGKSMGFERRFLADAGPEIHEAIQRYQLTHAPVVHAVHDDGTEEFWDGYRPDRLDALKHG